MKNACVVALVLFSLLLNNAFAKNSDPYTFTKTYQSSSGDVVFSHDRHADQYAKDCAFCHSALKIFGGTVNELFAHNFCKNCHLQNSVHVSEDCSICHSVVPSVSLAR